MTDLVQRLRGDFVPSSYHDIKSLLTSAADALEATDKEIARLEQSEALWRDDYSEMKSLCDQLGRALDGHCAPFLGHEQEHADALAAWREMK